jgi:hypothetical protein
MAKKRMGFEGKIFYGVAGSTAATEIENSQDINYDFDTDRGSTLERGTGSAPPIECETVTVRKVSISFKMLNKDGDTTLTALLAAAYGGTPVALRTKDKSAGKGFDGDCNLTVKHGKPIKGEQVFDFSATPNDDQRTPQLYI